MQMGVRWQTGAEPHRSVPPSLHGLIAEQESRYPDAASWTLTWLEGRPRCDLDGRVIVTLDAAGVPATVDAHDGATLARGSLEVVPDEEDDDWLA